MLLRRLYIVILFIFSFLSCGIDKLPNGFPEEDEFAQILADVHYADAVMQQVRITNRTIDSTAGSYYHYVLDKHQLTQEKFDTIVSWYMAHPKLYQKVYDRSIALISEKEAQWQREVKVIEERELEIRRLKEARSVWNMETNYFVSMRDTSDRQLPFEIIVDTIEQHKYKFSAEYQFLHGNDIKKSTLEIITLYADSSYDTILHKLPISHTSTKVEVEIGSDSALNILKMEGFLLKHDTLKEIRARIKGIEYEYIPDNDTLFLE